MKKICLSIFLILLFILPIVFADNTRYVFVPKGDIERAFLEGESGAFNRDPSEDPRFVDRLNTNGLRSEFDDFLDEKNVPFGFDTFQRLYNSDEPEDHAVAANLAFEFSSQIQFNAANKNRDEDLDMYVLPIEREQEVRNRLNTQYYNEINLNSPPDLLAQMRNSAIGHDSDIEHSYLSDLQIDQLREDWEVYVELANIERSRGGFSLGLNPKEDQRMQEEARKKLEDFQASLTSQQKESIELIRELNSWSEQQTKSDLAAYHRDVEKHVFPEEMLKVFAEDQFIDPGNDVLVIIDAGVQTGTGGYTIPGSGWIVISAWDVLADETILSHEIYHEENGLCDEYNYRTWSYQNKRRLKKGESGCPNDYDPIGCCRDNPEYNDYIYGPNNELQSANYDKAKYLSALNDNNIGKDCLPADNNQCNGNLAFAFSVLNGNSQDHGWAGYTCVGSPCESGDPHPPYCRSIMGPGLGKEFEKECFGEDFEKRNLGDSDSPLSKLSSQSQN